MLPLEGIKINYFIKTFITSGIKAFTDYITSITHFKEKKWKSICLFSLCMFRPSFTILATADLYFPPKKEKKIKEYVLFFQRK